MPDEMKQRRFPRPWDIEEINKAAFVVRDNNGTTLAYVYFEEEPGRRTAAGLLTRDEARRIAANIAKRRSCCDAISAVAHRFAYRCNNSFVESGLRQTNLRKRQRILLERGCTFL
jgi:hypothetical protein